jgi:phosphoribosylglycinamide formyltransferase 1
MTTLLKTHTLGVILSGRGSNFTAILTQIRQGLMPGIHIGCVISNHANAQGLRLARQAGLPVITLHGYNRRAERDRLINYYLQRFNCRLVILAGYDRILGEPVLSTFSGRILNIHPSLLPHYGGKGMVGMAVHQAVLDAGETQSGCTVHEVTEGVDEGQILGQSTVPVLPGDTAETLAARVLIEEHLLYSKIIRQVLLDNAKRPD